MRCRLVVGGRSAIHVVASSAHHLDGLRCLALMDHVVAAGAAECPGVHHAAADCPGTVPVFHTIRIWRCQHDNRETHQLRAWDADATARYQSYPGTNHKT